MLSSEPVAKLSSFMERRSSIRFPLELNVTCRSASLQNSVLEGRSVNVSSNGLLFCGKELPRVGETVEVSLEWPVKIDGTCPLKLVVQGKVVRANNKAAAIKLTRYEFRTLGKTRFTSLLGGTAGQAGLMSS